jgi:hypothetical protein
VKFTYELEGIGWASAYIEINNITNYFSVSYLTDALKALLEGIMSLLPECVSQDELKNHITFEWHAEPGGSLWSITALNKDQLQITIESYEDLDNKLGRKITLDEKCNKIEFINCIIEEASNILKQYGFVGYRETWYEHDFPISSYLKLKNYLITGKDFQVEHIERYPGNEYSRSELEKELILLDISDND